jgi:hypothetical protein
MEKIRTDSPEFQSATREQIAEWDSEGLIAWNPRNQIARQLSEEAQAKRKASEKETESGTSKEPEPEPSPLDQLGIAPDERLWSGHPLVQRAIRSGDSALLAEIYADERYDSLQASGPSGGFTRSDIENFYNKSVS